MKSQKRSQSASQSQKKRTNASLWYRALVSISALGLVVLAGSMIFQIIGVFEQNSAIEQEKQDFLAQIHRIEQDSNELSKLQEFLQTDEYVEREAKHRLDKAKPEEEVRFVTPGELVEDMSEEELIRTLKEPQSEQVIKAETNPEKWWAFFFDKKRLDEQPRHHGDDQTDNH